MNDTGSTENIETCLERGSKIIEKITAEKCESYILSDFILILNKFCLITQT